MHQSEWNKIPLALQCKALDSLHFFRTCVMLEFTLRVSKQMISASNSMVFLCNYDAIEENSRLEL